MKFSIEFKGVLSTIELKEIFVDLLKTLVEVESEQPPKSSVLSDEMVSRFWKPTGCSYTIHSCDKYQLSYRNTSDEKGFQKLKYRNEIQYLYPFIKENIPAYRRSDYWSDNSKWIIKNLAKYDSSPIALRVIELAELLEN